MKNKYIEELTVNDKLFKTEDIFGFIGFKQIGKLFNYEGPEVEFFKAQILVHGLQDFHITTAPNISDEQKREVVRETIIDWNKPREHLKVEL